MLNAGKITALFFTLLLLSGCFFGKEEALVGETVFNPDSLPPGTVQVSTALYMIPLAGQDDDGCMGYQAYAPGRLAVQVLHYRTSSGGFTTNRLDAACYENTE